MAENTEVETVEVEAEEATEVVTEVDVDVDIEETTGAATEVDKTDKLAVLEERIAKLTEALEAVTQPKPLTKSTTEKKNRGSKPPSLNTAAELPTIEDDASLSQWQREELFLKKRRSWINRQASKTRGGS